MTLQLPKFTQDHKFAFKVQAKSESAPKVITKSPQARFELRSLGWEARPLNARLQTLTNMVYENRLSVDYGCLEDFFPTFSIVIT